MCATKHCSKNKEKLCLLFGMVQIVFAQSTRYEVCREYSKNL